MRQEMDRLRAEQELNKSGLSSPGEVSEGAVGGEQRADVKSNELNTTAGSAASGESARSGTSSMDMADRQKYGMLEVSCSCRVVH
jgi:hypothetical protein